MAEPPAIACAVDPVILLGMHRSGTTMIAQLLDELGLFLGAKVQGDHEAIYFLELNDLLFKNVNATWDHPAGFLAFLPHESAVEMSVRCLRGDLLSRSARRFMGLKNSVQYRSIDALGRPWGWKDPRNVFTLPLWLKLFPKAKIINIVRNGIDVASSLMVRERKLLQGRQAKFDQRYNRTSTRSRLQRAGYRGSARCLSIEGGFSLWEEYVGRAERVMEGLPNPQVTVVYERFLEKPKKHLRQLVDFCQLPTVSDQAIAKSCQSVNAGRGLAFLNDPELNRFYQSVRTDPLMVRYGYDGLG
ncbi:MAG: sulfotransferase [Phycisphaerales bacterium]|jgi:hypothetical protein|nr:sulfotransferase [Phycisphaerales bacterium]